jgi:hypothetical protein
MKFQNIINDIIGVRNPYGLIQKAGKTRRKSRNKSRTKSRTKSKTKTKSRNKYLEKMYYAK